MKTKCLKSTSPYLRKTSYSQISNNCSIHVLDSLIFLLSYDNAVFLVIPMYNVSLVISMYSYDLKSQAKLVTSCYTSHETSYKFTKELIPWVIGFT